MSEEKETEGVVIDVTPEPPEPPEETPVPDDPGQAPPPQAGRKGGGLPLVVAIVALLIGIALAGAGYWLFDRARQDFAALDQRLAQSQAQSQARDNKLQQAVDTANQDVQRQSAALSAQKASVTDQKQTMTETIAAFAKQEELLAGENLRMQEREGELRAAVAEVHRRVGRSGTQWMIAEAEYLIRIANHRIQLARDTATARVALGLADQRLRDTQDPGWSGVRAQLARDMAVLGGTASVDSTGIAARLTAVLEQIPQLKLAAATIGAERTLPAQTPRLPSDRNWETLLSDVVAGVKDSMRIRRRDAPVQAMLAPEHQFFLYENLKLQIESARLALARQDPGFYAHSLEAARAALAGYFDPGHPVTASVGSALAELTAVDIRPDMPDISNSLRVLRARQKLMNDLAPAAAEIKE